MSNDLIPTQQEMSIIKELSQYAIESKFFEKLGGKSGIFTIMMYAKELGIPPMQALFGGMHNVQGKIEVAPVQMNAMIRQAGHRIDIVKHDNNICTLKGTRKGSGEILSVSFTINDAKIAGIYKEGGSWTKYPQDMLWARAMSRLGRRLFPDVIGSMYVEGEVDESIEVNGACDSTIAVEGSEEKAEVVETPEEKAEVVETPEEKEDITVEKSAELISKFVGLENDEQLKGYISWCKSKTKSSLTDITNKCIDKKEKFIDYFTEWKSKQSQTSTEN